MQEVARRWEFYREIENRQELSFTPLPDDIIVAVPQKCGTTWITVASTRNYRTQC
jgi:hypothetical protein